MHRASLLFRESAAILLIVVVLASCGLGTIAQLENAARVQSRARAALRLDRLALQWYFREERDVYDHTPADRLAVLSHYRAAVAQLALTFARLMSVCRSLGGDDRFVEPIEATHMRWQRLIANPVLEGGVISRSIRLLDTSLLDEYRVEDQSLDAQIELQANLATEQTRWAILANLFVGVALIAATLFFRALSQRRQERLQAKLSVDRVAIERLQTVFTSRSQALPGVAIGAAYLVADTDSGLGGDLFETQPLDTHRSYILVADVSGKGVSAAAETALIRYAVRGIAQHVRDPGLILWSVNRLFARAASNPESFAAAFLSIYDRESSRLTYASAGLGSAYVRRSGVVEQLPVSGPVIGMDEGSTFESHTLSLCSNDLLVVATDGLTEARMPDSAMLDDEGVMRWIEELSTNDPQGFVDQLVMKLRANVDGGIRDDLAVVAMRSSDRLEPLRERPTHVGERPTAVHLALDAG